MAEAPAAEGGGPLKVITRKVGPLPVWAYAAILVLAYYLYRRSHSTGSATSGAAADTSQTDQNTYVPGFDAAGAGGGGGIGATTTPTNVNNYYYGDQAAQQAAGGGTAPAPGVGGPGTGPTGVQTPGGGTQFGPNPPSSAGIHYFGPAGAGVYYPPVNTPVSTSGRTASAAPVTPHYTVGTAVAN